MKEVENMPIQEMSTMEVPKNTNTLFLATMERAVRVEEELKHQRELLIHFREDATQGFQRMDKRFDDMFKYLEMSREDSNKRFDDVNRRFEDMNKRFDDMFKYLEMSREDSNKRFDDVNKRFEDMNKRFDDMFKYLEMSREDSNKRFDDVNKRFEDMNTRFDSVDKNVAFMIKFSGWFGGACVAGLTLLMTLYRFL